MKDTSINGEIKDTNKSEARLGKTVAGAMRKIGYIRARKTRPSTRRGGTRG